VIASLGILAPLLTRRAARAAFSMTRTPPVTLAASRHEPARENGTGAKLGRFQAAMIYTCVVRLAGFWEGLRYGQTS
jgi:hypothetical protein